MNDAARRIAENLADVRSRIAAAAKRSGRTADAVTLVAVTKYVSIEAVHAVVEAGCRDLGESRPQELWAKAAALADPSIRWHMVGHLQTNKVRRTLPLVQLIQSVDRTRLLAAIDEEAAALGRTVDALVEVNISGDACKTGLGPEELERILEQAASLEHVNIRGLMGMARLEGDQDAARRDFAALRTLRDKLAPRFPSPMSLAELSMGMSGDFEAAIEEGATIVRLGSALFEGSDEMIALETHAEGTILPVKAHSAARRNEIKGARSGSLQVSVTQAPEKGKANKAIIALLAKSLGIRKSQIELVAGETSPQKRFLVRGITRDELSARIDNALSSQ